MIKFTWEEEQEVIMGLLEVFQYHLFYDGGEMKEQSAPPKPGTICVFREEVSGNKVDYSGTRRIAKCGEMRIGGPFVAVRHDGSIKRYEKCTPFLEYMGMETLAEFFRKILVEMLTPVTVAMKEKVSDIDKVQLYTELCAKVDNVIWKKSRPRGSMGGFSGGV